MNIEIKQKYGHYEMYVDGNFYGSYDTVLEAVKDLELIRAEKEGA